jgi:hypothetical protein
MGFLANKAFIHTLYERIGMGTELTAGANLTVVVETLNSNLTNHLQYIDYTCSINLTPTLAGQRLERWTNYLSSPRRHYVCGVLFYQEHVNISIRFNDIPAYDQPNLLSQRKPDTLSRHI